MSEVKRHAAKFVDANDPGIYFVVLASDYDALAAELAACKKDADWMPIETLPNDERLILAGRPDGAMMMWRASLLTRNLAGPTPAFLRFDPTHWMNVPAPPIAARATELTGE